MSGVLTLHRPPSPSNVYFAFLTRASQSNTNFGIGIQARQAWRWTTFIMHELCGVRTSNYDSFNWKQALFRERIPKKYGKIIKICHLLRGITLWTIWIKQNDKVFNQTHWHESKIKQQVWDELIIYAKMAWKRVTAQIKISSFSAVAMLQAFDKTWVFTRCGCTPLDLHQKLKK